MPTFAPENLISQYEEFRKIHPNSTMDLETYASTYNSFTKDRVMDPIRKINEFVQKGIDYTGLPDVAGAAVGGIGQLADQTFDTGTRIEEAVTPVGRGLPRMMGEVMATGASSIPIRVAGYAGSALAGAADTGSLLGGAISAGSLGLMNKALPMVGKAAATKVGDWLGTTGVKQNLPLIPEVAKLGAENVAASVIGEGTRQASMSVGPNAVGFDAEGRAARDPFTVENVAANVAGNLAFAPIMAKDLMNPMTVSRSKLETAKNEVNQERRRAAAEVNQEKSQLEMALDTYNVEAALETSTPESLQARKDTILDLIKNPGAEADLVRRARELESTTKSLPPKDGEETVKFIDDLQKFRQDVLRHIEGTDEGKVVLVKELQKKGFLPEITHESLQKDFSFSLDRMLGDPEAAWKAVAQKQANQIMDGLSAAIELRNKTEKAKTGYSANVLEVNAFERDAIDALVRLPSTKQTIRVKNDKGEWVEKVSTYQAEVAKRYAELRSEDSYDSYGKPQSRLRSFEDALFQAANTFDPATNTFKFREGDAEITSTGKRKQRYDNEGNPLMTEKVFNLSDLLTNKGPNGEKLPFLKYARKEVGEGATPEKEMGVMPTADTLKDTEIAGGTKGEAAYDEENFPTYTDMERARGNDAHQGLQALGKEYDAMVAEGKTADPSTEPVNETNVARNAAQKIQIQLDELKPLDLWKKVRDLYQTTKLTGEVRSNKLNDFRVDNMHLAVKAALENLGRERGKGDGSIGEAGEAFLKEFQTKTNTAPLDTPYQSLFSALKRTFESDKVVPVAGTRSVMNSAIANVLERIVGKETLQPLLVREKPVKDQPAKATVGNPNGIPTEISEIPGGRYAQETTAKGSVRSEVSTNNPVERIRSIVSENVGRIFRNAGMSGDYAKYMTEVTTKMFELEHANMGRPEISVQKLNNLTENPSGQARVTADPLRQKHISSLAVTDIIPQKPMTEVEAHAAVRDYVQTIFHELEHVNQYIRDGWVQRPDVYSDQTKVLQDNFDTMASRATRSERHDMMNLIERVMVPEELRTNRYEVDDMTGQKVLYGSKDPDEFMAQIKGYMVSFLTAKEHHVGVKSVKDALLFLPDEVQQYLQLNMRQISDVMGAALQLADNRDVAASMGMEFKSKLADSPRFKQRFKQVMELAETMTRSKSTIAKATAEALLSGTGKGVAARSPVQVPYQTIWGVDEQPVFGPMVKRLPAAEKTISDVQKQIFGDLTEGGTRPGWLSRMYMPFTNLLHQMEREGVPLAKNVGALAHDFTPLIARIHTDMLEPFLAVDRNGKKKLDENNPLIRKIQTDPRGEWRKRYNKVLAWQNAKGVLMFENVDGVLKPTEQAAAVWKKFSSGLSAEDQAVVINGVDATMKSFEKARNHLVNGAYHIMGDRVSAILMLKNKGMQYEQAMQMGDMLVRGLETGDLSKINLPPEQIEAFKDLLIGKPNEAGGTDGMLAEYQRLKQHLDNRPYFASEQLPGDWIIRFRTPENEVKYLSAMTKGAAEQLTARLIKEGNTMEGFVVDRKDLKNYNNFDNPAALLDKFVALEGSKWNSFLTSLEGHYDPTLIQELRGRFQPGEASEKEMFAQGTKQFMQENKRKVDLTRYDYIEGMMEGYFPRLASSLAQRMTRSQMDLILQDPRSRPYKSFEKIVRENFEHIYTPTPEAIQEIRAGTSAMFLGLNLSSMAIEGTQSLTSTLPWIIAESKSGGIVEGAKHLAKAMGTAFKFTSSQDWVQEAVAASKVLPKNRTLEQEQAVVYQRAQLDGEITHGAIGDLNDTVGQDQRMLMARRFGTGEYGDTTVATLLRNKLYLAGQMGMKAYSMVSAMNTKTSVLTGTQIGYEKGLRGDELYAYAKKFKNLSTGGGGKANAPGYVATAQGGAKSMFQLMNTLQQYGLLTVSMYSQMGREAIGKTNITPAQKAQSRKALGTLLMMQVAVGGAMSLPFAQAALVLLEKQFGIPAEQAVREGLASLAGDDEELGTLISDTFMAGAGTQLSGIDLSARVGVSNLFGFSAYNGFNAADIFGPVGSLVGNMANAANQFSQGNPVMAAKELVPATFRNAVIMADSKMKYGDFGIRDKSQNLLYQPTDTESVMRAIGFKPHALGQVQLGQKLLRTSNDRYQRLHNQTYDNAAVSMLSGDNTEAMALANETLGSDPTGRQYDAVLRSLLDRAENMVVAKDQLATGPVGNSDAQRRIATLLGPDVVPRRSEMEMFRLRAQLAIKLGAPQLINNESVSRAVLLDSLMKGSAQAGSQMTRAEATRMAMFMGQ